MTKTETASSPYLTALEGFLASAELRRGVISRTRAFWGGVGTVWTYSKTVTAVFSGTVRNEAEELAQALREALSDVDAPAEIA